MSPRCHRNGFTVRDLIVATIVLAVLLSLVAVGLQFTREATRQSHCSANLTHIVFGLHEHLIRHRVYPSACTADRDPATGLVTDVGLSGNTSTAGWEVVSKLFVKSTKSPGLI